MKIHASIHLDKDDKIKQVNIINNFFTLQLEVLFESGLLVLIDEDFLNELDKYRMKKNI